MWYDCAIFNLVCMSFNTPKAPWSTFLVLWYVLLLSYSYSVLFPGLICTKPTRNLPYSLLPEESVQIITTDLNQLDKKWIELKYTLNEGKTTEYLCMRCENAASNQWSYTIIGCMDYGWNKQFLNDVPPGKLKHWTITKTSTHLKIVCNNVTVLNFNFATDCSPGFEDGYQVWSKRCTALNMRSSSRDSFLVNAIS